MLYERELERFKRQFQIYVSFKRSELQSVVPVIVAREQFSLCTPQFLSGCCWHSV
jgi:hypothetical protein